MHLRAILAIARKDGLDALLNKSSLMALLTPILLAVLFAVMTQLFGNSKIHILVYNPSNSAVEQVVSGAFANGQITRAGSADTVAAAFGPDGAHRQTAYAVGLVVPAEFDASLRTGSHAQVALYTNGDEVNSQQRVLLLSALDAYSRGVASPQSPASILVATVNPPAASLALNLGKFYAVAALLSSFLVGTALVPGLLIEEKEKKTLRMLMVSSASWGDIIAGKLLVALSYQLTLALVVLAVTSGFAGQIPLVLLFALLGSCLSVLLGLLFGSIFKTTSSAGAFSGMVSFLYIVPVFFVGPFDQALQNNPVAEAMRIVPTYYLADGAINALQGRSTTGQIALDVGVVAGCLVALFAASMWAVRRQAAVASTI